MFAFAAIAFSFALASSEPAPSIREFKPSVHGFMFGNTFKDGPLGSLAMFGSTAGSSRYGLCGGMSAAALDLFLAARPRPSAQTPPKANTPLYAYLLRRQLDSLGSEFALIRRFADAMALETFGPSGLAAMSVKGVDDIAAALSASQPAPIGLVHSNTGKLEALWHNHQVLGYQQVATAPTTNTPPSTFTFRIYDPNFPRNDEVTLCVTLQPVGFQLAPGPFPIPTLVLGALCTRDAPSTPLNRGGKPKVVRGLFLMPYAPAVPPAFSPNGE